MNYERAIKVLELPENYDAKLLKQKYYAKALEFHPDKNKETPSATQKFQEISEAYNYLRENNSSNDTEDNYMEMLEKFINVIIKRDADVAGVIKLLNDKYVEIKDEILNRFSTDILVKIERMIHKYNDLFNISPIILKAISNKIKERTKNNRTITIIPTLNNLMNDEIYKLNGVLETDILIPMWHHELVYNISDSLLIIQCAPELPDYITIDEYNNLYVNLSFKLREIIDNLAITINIDNRELVIPLNKLYIKKFQRYTFKEAGIANIDEENIYNIENRSNIYVDIYFTDIK